MSTHLIAFRDGSYKKVTPTAWKHSQWIHFTLADGSVVMVNPANVNYIHRDIDGSGKGAPELDLAAAMDQFERDMSAKSAQKEALH